MQVDAFSALISTFIAFVVGGVIGINIMGGYPEERHCERQNNVYDCTRIYIPTPIEEDNQ
jgi:hypothetical protein